MNGKQFIQGLNGKKTPIALILTILGGGIGYGELKSTVKNHTKEIDVLKPMVIQVARIEQNVKGIDENFIDFRTEQRKDNGKKDKKLEDIYRAIMAK